MTRPGVGSNFTSQSTNWHAGWTIGGGLEYVFARNWTVGVEYNVGRAEALRRSMFGAD